MPGQGGCLFRRDNMIRMHHLDLVVEPFRPAADDTDRTGGEQFFNIIPLGVEIDNLNRPAAGLGHHPPGAAAPRWWLVMGHDRDFHGDDGPVFNRCHRWPLGPVNHACGQVPQQVDDMIAHAFFQQPRHLVANAGQHRQPGEKPEQFFGSGELLKSGRVHDGLPCYLPFLC